LSYSVVNVT